MVEPIRFEYRYETRADIARVYKAMSDTDSFNRVAKANMTFAQEVQPSGVTVTVGAVSKLGMTIKWREQPFAFRAPHWFRIQRDFLNGPGARMTAQAQFTSLPSGGTALHYQVEFLSRSAIFRPVLVFDLKRSLEPNLRQAIEAALAFLEKEVDLDPSPTNFVGPPPALRSHEASRLAELASAITPSALRDRLVSFIRAAPEREQQSISPIAMAQAWVAPLEEVALLFVAAAKVGLLGVRIDLLCPACLVPKAMVDESGRLPDVHCETCGIKLDATYPEALAIHFFPSPQVRSLKIKAECIGSPSRTPQIVAQDSAAPGAEVDLATSLTPGTYQLRTMPAFGPSALIDVREGDVSPSATFTLQSSLHPQLARLRPEPTQILFRNLSDQPVVAVLERVEPPRRVLSLGRMLIEYPVLKEILPPTGFISSLSSFPGVAISVRTVTPEEAASVAARLTRARSLYVSGVVVLALYADGERAHEDLKVLDLTRMLVGVAEGIVAESSIGARQVVVGPAVDKAYEMMCGATFGSIRRANTIQ